jgi:hypothetical protein
LLNWTNQLCDHNWPNTFVHLPILMRARDVASWLAIHQIRQTLRHFVGARISAEHLTDLWINLLIILRLGRLAPNSTPPELLAAADDVRLTPRNSLY